MREAERDARREGHDVAQPRRHVTLAIGVIAPRENRSVAFERQTMPVSPSDSRDIAQPGCGGLVIAVPKNDGSVRFQCQAVAVSGSDGVCLACIGPERRFIWQANLHDRSVGCQAKTTEAP